MLKPIVICVILLVDIDLKNYYQRPYYIRLLITMETSAPNPQDGQHRRSKTEFKTSVLKTFMQHKRTPSDGTPLSPASLHEGLVNGKAAAPDELTTPIPSIIHYAGVLGELPPRNYQDQGLPSPAKSLDFRRPPLSNGKSLHRKGLSTISLKQLAGRDNDKDDKLTKPKKSKSSANLSNILLRNKNQRSSQKLADEVEAKAAKDKENRTPADQIMAPPIYAQFSRQSFATQALGGKFFEDEAQVYTPDEYSQSKQGYFDLVPPQRASGDSHPGSPRTPKARTPSTTWLPSGLSVKDIENKRVSRDIRDSSEVDYHRFSADTREPAYDPRPSMDKSTSPTKSDFTFAQRSVRAFNAVWSHKKEAEVPEVEKPKPFTIDPKDVDAELEAMLGRRNIPENSRHKMRSLAKEVKIELIKQDWAEIAAAKNASVSTNSSRPGTGSGDESGEIDETAEKNEKKKSRPLSMNFTISKGKKDAIPSPKKSKSDGTFSRHKRSKSTDSTASAKSTTSSGSGVASTLIAKAKGQLPDDFVAYLRKAQKPDQVEVGKLHKLRLLLRNEMVAWTDSFITSGGMTEIVALLRRIMAVEWR